MDFNLSENTTIIADTARRYLKDQYSFDTYRNVLVQSNHLNPSRWQTMRAANLGSILWRYATRWIRGTGGPGRYRRQVLVQTR